MRKISVFVLFMFVVSELAYSQGEFLYIGTFSVRGSQGIYVYSFNRSTKEFTPVGTFHSLNDPTFLVISPDQKYLYAANRQSTGSQDNYGSVTSFAIDRPSGKLSELSRSSSYGNSPCHINVSPDSKWLFLSHYRDGSVTVLGVDKKGRITGLSDSVIHRGSSINRERQESAHAHSTNFFPRSGFFITADLGSDMLWIHNWRRGKISKPVYAAIGTVPGSGPRHFVIHPSGAWIYVAEELSSTVSRYYFHPDKVTITREQRVSTLPESFTGANSAADIHFSPDYRFLYVSNRGHNSIAVYTVDSHTGELSPAGHQAVQGKTPRNFYVDSKGDFVLVANQDTDEVVFFLRDSTTGLLNDTGVRLAVPSPVCLQMTK